MSFLTQTVRIGDFSHLLRLPVGRMLLFFSSELEAGSFVEMKLKKNVQEIILMWKEYMFPQCVQGILALPVMLHIIALIMKCESLDFRCLGNTTLFAQPQSSGRF